jgi:hypothetical protein
VGTENLFNRKAIEIHPSHLARLKFVVDARVGAHRLTPVRPLKTAYYSSPHFPPRVVGSTQLLYRFLVLSRFLTASGADLPTRTVQSCEHP